MLATRLLALALVVILTAPGAHAQAAEGEPVADEFGFAPATGFDLPALPPVDSLASDWKERFATTESTSNFKLLREYRTEKQARIVEFRQQLDWYPFYRTNAEDNRTQLLGYKRVLEADLQQASGDIVEVRASLPVMYDEMLGAQTPGPVAVQQVRALIGTLTEREQEVRRYLDEVQNGERALDRNIRVAEADVRQVEAAIDSALAPELRSQSFRTWISGFFAVLIAIMIIAFFSIIYVRSDGNVASLMLSDGGLQFVTIFVLIIAIILFGILSILEGKELAAILSGLAGYILGRGSQGKSDGAPAASAPSPRRLVRRAGTLAVRAPGSAGDGAAAPAA